MGNFNRFKNATKRIGAVGASALIVSSAAFAAGLGDYPRNFVDDGKFEGQIVVGASSAAADSVTAMSIIEDLKKEFGGGEEKVMITYKTFGDLSKDSRLDAMRTNQKLNFGETVESVSKISGFGKRDTRFLDDKTFKNGISDTDYSQTLTLKNGSFNYALRDEVDGVDEIVDGVFYADREVFAVYTLELDKALSLSGQDYEEDLIGNQLMIMGNEYTISEVSRDGSNNLDGLVLLGGANKISLGAGESSTFKIDGKEYEVELVDASNNKAQVIVNGKAASIEKYSSKSVGGVNVVVTDVFSTSRTGYASLIIGGHEISLEQRDVQINGVDVDDVYEGYEVDVEFTGTGFENIVISYMVDEDVLLRTGESLRDVLFDSFELVYEGTNNVNYETIEVRVSDDDVKVIGTTVDGERFNKEFLHMADRKSSDTAVWLKGDRDEDRVFFEFSKDMSGVLGAPLINTDGTMVSFNLSSSDIRGSGFLLEDNNERQFWYQIKNIDTSDATHEASFGELLRGEDESGIEKDEWDSHLGMSFVVNEGINSNNISLNQLGNIIAFENEMLLTLTSNTETLNISNQAPQIDFRLDSEDVRGDDVDEENDGVKFVFTYDSSDEEFRIASPIALDGAVSSTFVNAAVADNVDGDNDIKTFVTKYGIMVEYDNDDGKWAKIKTPDRQVEGRMSLLFGGALGEQKTIVVDASNVDEMVSELEGDGNIIVSTEEVSFDDVGFDISAPLTDEDIGGDVENLIVVGGPAVNKIAAELVGLSYPTYGSNSGVSEDEGIIRYFEDSNVVLVYGYSAEDTAAAARKLSKGPLSGISVRVNN